MSKNCFAVTCTWNDSGGFYGLGCDDQGIRNSVARALPAMVEISRFNPATLPTLPTPLGIEANVHSKDQPPERSNSNLTLIKGFQGIGFGLGSWVVGTYSGPDIRRYFEGSSAYGQQFQYYQSQHPDQQGYRLGSAFALPLGEKIKEFLRVRFGGAIGRGQIANSKATTLGFTGDFMGLMLGLSWMNETVSSFLPAIKSTTFSVGYEVSKFYFGLNRTSVDIPGTSFPTSTMLSLRWSDLQWSFSGSIKFYAGVGGQAYTWGSASLRRQFGTKLSAGYIYGLYPNSHSLSGQVFF